MILAFALATTGTPVAVEVAGMPPQMEIATAVAARENWRLVCRGRAGEMTVLRFALPTGFTSDVLTRATGDRDQFATMLHIYYADERMPKRCDEEVPRQEGSPIHALTFGPADALARLVPVARSCGFAKATIHDYRPDDWPTAIPGVQPDWKTLDAGEDMLPRYGPMACFSVMARPGGANRWK